MVLIVEWFKFYYLSSLRGDQLDADLLGVKQISNEDSRGPMRKLVTVQQSESGEVVLAEVFELAVEADVAVAEVGD